MRWKCKIWEYNISDEETVSTSFSKSEVHFASWEIAIDRGNEPEENCGIGILLVDTNGIVILMISGKGIGMKVDWDNFYFCPVIYISLKMMHYF